MRLYPPLWAFGREAIEDWKIGFRKLERKRYHVLGGPPVALVKGIGRFKRFVWVFPVPAF
jgi:hypothetical protein